MKKPLQFKKHYTVEEAKALLPKIQGWLNRIDHLRKRIEQLEKRLNALLEKGNDVGGNSANEWVKALADLKSVLDEFEVRDVYIKDIERGLIDFPAMREGREIFLCWERGEENIEHWHELDTGFGAKEPL